MSNQANLYGLLPSDIDGFEELAELALDLRWSWNHATDRIWEQLDPILWRQTHNPWGLLQAVSREKMSQLLADPAFRSEINELVQLKRDACEKPCWFQQTFPSAPLTCIAYFSMEFMLSESLPIYSGGLGNVAGDQLKGASDLGIPLVGIGLLYQQGYFRQLIDSSGAQQAIYPFNDPGQLPITPLRQTNGEWLRLQLDLPGHSIWLRAWQVQVGRVRLYLLDSNDAANFPPYRGITSELYGDDPELRLLQELILGIGGWRLLVSLGLEPEVCHLNEGHAALAVLERARSFMLKADVPFETALAITRAGNVFTTHTAVAAGFDRFKPALIEHCLGGYVHHHLGISLDKFLALGRQNPGDANEDFNMAYLAIRGSGAVNGVSRLHGEVSRRLFAPLFPHWPLDEVPVGHITNGVHMPSWDSAAADDLWTTACCKTRWLGAMDNLGDAIRQIPDQKLWQFRANASKAFVDYVRDRLGQQLIARGEAEQTIAHATHLFDPNILTIGFARRFATYKRPNLLLQNPERLVRILTNQEHPVQLIIAGKAHPADKQGQALIQQWNQFIKHPEVRPHVVFLSDYDMLLAEQLVQGVDVWLNTPERPWEACGTSGMKVLVNGGINVSELDGWWAEAYSPELGWALGDGQEHGDDPAWNAAEAEALYDILEYQVVPEYYNRDRDGIPTAWVARMRESMAQLTPRFSTNRSLKEYIEHYYLPAAQAYSKRVQDNGEQGKRIIDWLCTLEKKWDLLRFGSVQIEHENNQLKVEAQVYLDGLNPDFISVELYAEGLDGALPVVVKMERLRPLIGATNGGVYGVSLTTTRPASDYTVRLVANFEGIHVPLEASYILWQH